MFFSLDVLSLLLIAALAQGLFILSVIAVRYKFRPTQNAQLFILIVLVVWLQAEFLAIRTVANVPLSVFFGTRYGSWLALGPLYYLYVHSSLSGKRQKFGGSLLHFVPFFVFVLVVPLIAGNFLGLHQIRYGMISPFYPVNHDVTVLQVIYTAVFIIQFIHLFIYIALARYDIQRYEKELKATYSSIDMPNLSWLKTVTFSLLLILGFAGLFIVLSFWYFSYNRNLDYLYVLPMAALIYLVAYKLSGVVWTSPPEQTADTANKYSRSSLRTEDAIRHKARLVDHMKTRPYLQNELRLSDLAQALDIPPHHLSQVLHEQLHTSFYDFINRHRVEEAQRLIHALPETSLLDIAFQSGFNNKTSFTNAFKKFAGQTPMVFRNTEKIPRS